MPCYESWLRMSFNPARFLRAATLLAINLLYVMVWGFAGIGKVIEGMPAWFGDKFGKTILATFPGLTASFWLLTASELLGFALAMAALARGEFLGQRPLALLPGMLVWSLFVFLQLGFGLWLTSDFNGTFQQFMYGSGTLVSLIFVNQALGLFGVESNSSK